MVRNKSKNFCLLLPILILKVLWQREVEGVEWIHGALKNVETVKKMINILDEFHNISKIDLMNNRKGVLFFDRIKQIDSQINNLKDMYIHNTRDGAYIFIPESGLFTEIVNVIIEMRDIERSYRHMMNMRDELDYYGYWILDFQYLNNAFDEVVTMDYSIDRRNILEFARQNVNPSSHSKIFNIFSNYIGYGNSLRMPQLNEIVRKLQEEDSPSISIQQHIYSAYLELTILGIKDYLVTKFSWAILLLSEGKDFTIEENNFIKEYEKRTSFMFNRLRAMLLENNTELRKSDPDKWEENFNYEQLTRLVQGYIANEATLNPKGSCLGVCSNYANTYTHTCSDSCCEKDKIEGTGKILSCESGSSDTFYEICLSKDPKRRYDHVTVQDRYLFTSDTYTYGGNHTCSWQRQRFRSCSRVYYMCTFCFCLIDDQSEKSDRFFNLREVLSDIDQNKVVTGVRFVKKNRIMHLQIQQGTLGSLGHIKSNTTDWKDVEEYELHETIDEVDYITFNSNRKSIDLDDIIDRSPHSVVTGVKLSMLDNHLRLEVRTCTYIFETGEIFKSKTTCLWIQNTSRNGKKLPLKGLLPNRGPNVSTRAPRKSSPSPDIYNYVEFTHSDQIDDVSQTTLPFIDSQDVTFHPPTPLSGIGLYHKGLEGYGGFLAPKIFAFNISAHM